MTAAYLFVSLVCAPVASHISENGICIDCFSNAYTLINLLVLCPKNRLSRLICRRGVEPWEGKCASASGFGALLIDS